MPTFVPSVHWNSPSISRSFKPIHVLFDPPSLDKEVIQTLVQDLDEVSVVIQTEMSTL